MRLRLATAATACLLIASSRADRKVSVPDASRAEKLLFADVRDDKLDGHDAVTAAIAASTASATQKEKALQRWTQFLDVMVVEGASMKPARRAEVLLDRIHELVLTRGYFIDQNDMVLTLTAGTYNCVTSALIFQAAGKHMGLDVRGVLVPTHVYVRVVIEGVSFDVETTSPDGFLLARDDEAYRKFLKQMQLDNERKSGRQIGGNEKFFRKEIDAIGLVSLLYTNRGAIAVREGKAKEAIGLFARSSLLAQDERYARDSRDLLLAQAAEKAILDGDLAEARKLFEFAIADPGGDPIIVKRLRENIAYCWSLEAHRSLTANEYQKSLDGFAAASRFSDDPAHEQNRKAVFATWGIRELEAKRYPAALDVFARARREFPNDKDFTQNLKATYYEWSRTQLAAGSCNDALATTWNLKAALPSDPDVGNIIGFTAAACADQKVAKGDWQGAITVLETVLLEAPSPDLKSRTVLMLTNAGVEWAKAGDTSRAEAAWKRALQLDPGATAARTNLQRSSAR